MRTPRVLKVFLSSPGDVNAERNLADTVLQNLERTPAWKRKFKFEIVRWDDPFAATPMDARLSPLDAIRRHLPTPSECDIIVVILWSRMGTPLAEPRRPDGRAYLSGTEWEFEDALKGEGRILLFRRTDEPQIRILDPEKEQKTAQYRLVLQFFDHLTNEDGSFSRSIIFYGSESEFPKIFQQSVEGILSELEVAASPDLSRDDDAIRLREAPSLPALPASPYPLLQPYMHPQTFAGREEELKKLEQLVRQPQLVLGLYSASGAGKSSLLLAGLVPNLRTHGYPVSIDRRPGDPGLANRLLLDLLELPAAAQLADDRADAFDFSSWIRHARSLAAGKPPVLILDQFDDVMRLPDVEKNDVLARLGPLVASTARRLPGEAEYACRWVFCYRHEYHGVVAEWLQDVLKQARDAGRATLESLPYDLSDLFDSWAMPVIGTSADTGLGLAGVRRALLRAIARPLELLTADGQSVYGLRFREGGAERLADAFARARRAQPSSPLVPELQVVLRHLLDQVVPAADGPSFVDVPTDSGELDQKIDDALATHLKRALESAFPLGRDADVARSSRARALLVLRELADMHGQRRKGLTKADLARAFGPEGDRVIKALESPHVRLIVQEGGPHGFVYALSHDRMADLIKRFFESERLRGDLDLDHRMVDLRRFVAQRSELYLRSNDSTAIDLTIEQYELIESAVDALIRDADHRRWWTDCVAWFDLRRELRAEPPALGALVELVHSHPDWRHIGRRIPAAEINPKIFWAWLAPSSSNITKESANAMAVLDVIDHLHMALLDSREAFYAMTYAAEEIRSRHPEHADRARALNVVLREVFSSEYGPNATLPPFSASRWYLPEEKRMGFVHIPAGDFLMGSDKSVDRAAYPEEQPQGMVDVGEFYIARYEVTAVQFGVFLRTYDSTTAGRARAVAPPYHPVTGVSWLEAIQYCDWLHRALLDSVETPYELRRLLQQGWRVSLPSEAEWEKAARGTDGRTFPWGEEDFDAAERASSGRASTLSVGSFPRGASPYGVLDMSGNVWEWTRSLFWPYPYNPTDGRENLKDIGERVMRGGYFGSYAKGMRLARRHHREPEFRESNLGFRVAISRF